MTPLTDEQADLAAKYFHVATWSAKQASWRWPAADRDDLTSWACEGLMRAAQQWDPDGGMTFPGFARLVIRTHIIDSWRLATKRGRRRTFEFAFDHQEMTNPEIIRAAASIEDGFERIENQAHAAATIDTLQLTERERYVIVELGSGTTMREIAAALGVTESRVCQIRKAVYDRLPVNCPPPPPRCAWCAKAYKPGLAGTRQRHCSQDCLREAKNARRRQDRGAPKGPYRRAA